MNSDDSECFVTMEETKARLESLEAKLAEILNIKDNVRETLIQMARDHKLDEDKEFVESWLEEFSSYVACQQSEAYDLLELILEDETIPPLKDLSSVELEAVSAWAASSFLAAHNSDVTASPIPECLKKLLPRNHWLL